MYRFAIKGKLRVGKEYLMAGEKGLEVNDEELAIEVAKVLNVNKDNYFIGKAKEVEAPVEAPVEEVEQPVDEPVVEVKAPVKKVTKRKKAVKK